MPDSDALKRLGGGRWETRDGRFAIEPQSGTWVIVDNEQTDELGLPLVRGPFGSLTAAKEAIESARTEGPKTSPLADRLEQAKGSRDAKPGSARELTDAGRVSKPSRPKSRKQPPVAHREPESPPEPRWLRELESTDQRKARDLIARLKRMGVGDPEQVVRAEIAENQPALARLAVERAIAGAVASSKDSSAALRAAVKAIVRGADVELGVSWRLVDEQDRRLEKLELPD